MTHVVLGKYFVSYSSLLLGFFEYPLWSLRGLHFEFRLSSLPDKTPHIGFCWHCTSLRWHHKSSCHPKSSTAYPCQSQVSMACLALARAHQLACLALAPAPRLQPSSKNSSDISQTASARSPATLHPHLPLVAKTRNSLVYHKLPN